MANPKNGEIEFEIGGKVYSFLLGTYGLARLEQRRGKPWPAILKEAINDGWGVDLALACFHCGLLLHHEPMTEKEASLLLDELGMDTFTRKFVEGMQAQFGGQEGADGPPPVAAVKTNGTSGKVGTHSSAIG